MRSGRRERSRPTAASRPSPAKPVTRPALVWWIVAGLTAIGIAVYARVDTLNFLNYDDPDYVTGNPHVLGGLTWDGIRWALTSTESANWFPLTWVSHMLDVSLFGMNSAAHHLVNAGLHLATTVLLFLLLVRMTQAIWRSAMVAFIFGFHPLHVESVAWIAERKDVLSGLFGMVTLWTYVYYVARPVRQRYWLLVAVFAIALTTKSMLVTLPLLMLCLDLWPLRRWSRAAVLEKIPLAALSAAVSILTFMSQRSAGAVSPIGKIPLGEGVMNAVISYGVYVRQAIWPVPLSAFYPWTTPSPMAAVLTGGVLALALIACARLRARYPFLLSGYLWFLISLLPVIGIIPFGLHAHADRYMYLPLVGLAIAVVWSAGAFVEREPLARTAAVAFAIGVCCVFSALSWRQVGYWTTTQRVFEHALTVTPRNPVAHEALGMVARQSGDLSGAIHHYQEAIGIWPKFADARAELGEALIANGQPADAVPHLQAAIAAQPASPDAYVYLGDALRRTNDTAQAEPLYRTALRMNSGDARAHLGLAQCLADDRVPGDAAAEAQQALTLASGDPGLRRAAYRLLVQLGQGEAAALAAPDLVSTSGGGDDHLDRGSALARAGHFEEATDEFRAAIATDPANAKAHSNLGAALASLGRFDAAIDEFVAALKLNPNLPDVQKNLDLARELRRKK